jgi:2,3-dihydroxybiphenyl 1,2-dioxygenase
MSILRLGYLGLRSPDPQGWIDFGNNVLGTPLGESPDKDTVRLRVDRRPFAVSITRGAKASLDYLGWETASKASVEEIASRLDPLGVKWSWLNAETCLNRGVDHAISFTDPFNYTHEVYAGTRALARPLRPTAICSGFDGLGHAFLLVSDATKAEQFFVKAFEFLVSDRLDFHMGDHPFEPGPNPTLTSFLSTGTRHHALAVSQGRTGADLHGLAHLMIQVNELDDLGHGFDRAIERKSLMTTIGRHTNDRMLSFYFHAPDGTTVEYGWGGQNVPLLDSIPRYDRSTEWGHRPVEAGVVR